MVGFFQCITKICIPDFCRDLPFYRLPNDNSSAGLTDTMTSGEKVVVSSDGTRGCLSNPICVDCHEAFMTLCAYPHVGYYLAGHLAV